MDDLPRDGFLNMARHILNRFSFDPVGEYLTIGEINRFKQGIERFTPKHQRNSLRVLWYPLLRRIESGIRRNRGRSYSFGADNIDYGEFGEDLEFLFHTKSAIEQRSGTNYLGMWADILKIYFLQDHRKYMRRTAKGRDFLRNFKKETSIFGEDHSFYKAILYCEHESIKEQLGHGLYLAFPCQETIEYITEVFGRRPNFPQKGDLCLVKQKRLVGAVSITGSGGALSSC